MDCSGISELFQVVCSSATAVHMLSGKAYARALRAHFLVQSALELSILQLILPLSLIEHLSIYDVDGKNYVMLVIEIRDSFQMNYQSILRQMSLKIYVH